MTIEEAVERILRGNPWRKCPECKGKGRIEDEPKDYVHAVDPCHHCLGGMLIVQPEYAEACRLLNRPVPVNNLRKIFEDIKDMSLIGKNESAPHWQTDYRTFVDTDTGEQTVLAPGSLSYAESLVLEGDPEKGP